MKGITYNHGSVVVLNMDTVPTFGVVCDIFVFNTNMYHLLCEVLFTVCFSHHFHAYEVSKQVPADIICCEQSDLHDHTVLQLYTIASQPHSLFVPLKYEIMEF